MDLVCLLTETHHRIETLACRSLTLVFEGDTHTPFSSLGRSLKLPQTATLALRAPEQQVFHSISLLSQLRYLSLFHRIPYLYSPAYQWYTSFDLLGDILPPSQQNPTPALKLLHDLVSHLTAPMSGSAASSTTVTGCGWRLNQIHLFGFAQGGTVCAEFALDVWKKSLSVATDSPPPGTLGSVVSISGPLLSYPTLSRHCPTPILVFHRPSPSEEALPKDAMTSFKKGFSNLAVIEAKKGKGGMPGSREEWEGIMRFWSERLGRRMPSQDGEDGLYEVLAGT